MHEHPRAQHVWVCVTGVWSTDRLPGLLLGWRLGLGGWEGWVISVQPGVGARGDGPYVRQAWLPATSIRPLDERDGPGGRGRQG